MIPNTLHYIWLSNDEKPELIKKCLASWGPAAPGFEIRSWSSEDFDTEALPLFVKQAVSERMWAFAADYLRLKILYERGGIYMDSDIFLKGSPKPFISDPFFSFVEYHEKGFKEYKHLVGEGGVPLTEGHIPGFCLQSAFMGSEPGHPFLKKCLEYYESAVFLGPDGKPKIDMIAPDIYALKAREFGFRYIDEEQRLSEGMHIYPSSLVAGSFSEIKKGNVAIHCCAGSWRKTGGLKKLAQNLIRDHYWIKYRLR